MSVNLLMSCIAPYISKLPGVRALDLIPIVRKGTVYIWGNHVAFIPAT